MNDTCEKSKIILFICSMDVGAVRMLVLRLWASLNPEGPEHIILNKLLTQIFPCWSRQVLISDSQNSSVWALHKLRGLML